jgi:hypothetical protein
MWCIKAGGLEAFEAVQGVLFVFVFADDLVNRAGSLCVGVEQEVEDEPVDAGLFARAVGNTLGTRHGELPLLVSGPRRGVPSRVEAAWL